MGAKNARPLEWMRSLPPPSTDLPRTQRDVLIQLALAMDKDGAGWVTQQRLAEEAAAGLATVKRAIAWGQRTGWLNRLTRGHRISDDRAAASTYQLSTPIAAGSASNGTRPNGSANELLASDPTAQNDRPNRSANEPLRGPIQEKRYIPKDLENKDLDLFGEFWDAYPRKTGKPAAEHAWTEAVDDSNPDATPNLIIDCARQYAKDISGSDPRFIMGAARWLVEKNWLDHLPCVKVELRGLTRTG